MCIHGHVCLLSHWNAEGWGGRVGLEGVWVIGSYKVEVCCMLLAVLVLRRWGSTGVGPPSSLPTVAGCETKGENATAGAHSDAEGAKIEHRSNWQPWIELPDWTQIELRLSSYWIHCWVWTLIELSLNWDWTMIQLLLQLYWPHVVSNTKIELVWNLDCAHTELRLNLYWQN